MIVGCSDTIVCTSFTSADCSREIELLVSSENDKESPRERLTPMMCAGGSCEVTKAGSTFVKSVVSPSEPRSLAW